MNDVAHLRLNDGQSIPQLGFGTARIKGDSAPATIAEAIRLGYRLIDSAAKYDNEREVGEAIRMAGVPRQELVVTTKVWPDRMGRDATLRSFDDSIGRLGLETIDLFLIHWPGDDAAARVESWQAMAELQQAGRARSIGVSNFSIAQIEALADASGVMASVNQVELHPLMQQSALRAAHARIGVATECYCPLGRRRLFDNPVIGAIGEKHRRSPAQVILRWHLQLGLVPIPKSANRDRMAANLAVWDFELDEDDMARIGTLDGGAG